MMDPVLVLSIALASVVGGVLLLLFQHWSPSWSASTKSGAQLPKGSFGWPIIGESIAFATNPALYASSHVDRYGNVFKSSLSFKPAILGATPEFAKFVLNDTDLFINGAPPSSRELLGPKSVLFQDGPRHVSMKKLIQKVLLPEALRTKVDVLETIVLENLTSWAERGTVSGRDATQKMTLDVSMWLLLGMGGISSTPEGRTAQENFKRLNKALGSFPLNLPGTTFNKGMKAKAALTQYIRELIVSRRAQHDTQAADMLGVLLASQENIQALGEETDLNDDTIADNLVLLFFAANDNTSTTLLWALKYLNENPDVYHCVQAEQHEILRSKDQSKEGPRLSWEDMTKMIYVKKLFQELQRILSIAPVVARQATRDVEYEGHLIPKGWLVIPLHNFIHANPEFHSDPESFNPDRFDATPRPYTFLPFAAGPHMCPGTEFAKLLFLIFIHHLTTTYTYESIAVDMGKEYIFYPSPVGGYPIHIRRRN